jgi:hypothetical protein
MPEILAAVPPINFTKMTAQRRSCACMEDVVSVLPLSVLRLLKDVIYTARPPLLSHDLSNVSCPIEFKQSPFWQCAKFWMQSHIRLSRPRSPQSQSSLFRCRPVWCTSATDRTTSRFHTSLQSHGQVPHHDTLFRICLCNRWHNRIFPRYFLAKYQWVHPTDPFDSARNNVCMGRWAQAISILPELHTIINFRGDLVTVEDGILSLYETTPTSNHPTKLLSKSNSTKCFDAIRSYRTLVT